MSQRGIQRWGPLAGPLFVVFMVAGFLIAGDSPDPDASNAKILKYLHDSSNYDKNIVGFFLLLAALLFLIAFFASLRSRLVDAEGGAGGLSALALGAGIVSSVLLFTAIAVFTSPVIAAHDSPRHALDPGIYRLTQDLGYGTWVASVVVGALVVWSTSVVALKTGVLPRWFGRTGVVVGVICLFALFFIPIFIFWLWILVAGILLVRSPGSAPAAEAVGPGGHGP